MVKLKELVSPVNELARKLSVMLKVGKCMAKVAGIDYTLSDSEVKPFVKALVEHVEKFAKDRGAASGCKRLEVEFYDD